MGGLPIRIRAWRPVAALAAAALTAGCGLATAPIIDPKGPIGQAESDLLFTAFKVMLIVVVPVIVLAFWFVLRYRAAGGKGAYAPDWEYSGKLDAVIWLVPALIVIALAVLVWTNTHKLDPYRPLASAAPPLEVQVVAQDWKWLFIYPAQDIAAVNELVFPAATPLSLKITSDTVMNAFYIPGLGGQIYAMAGMRTELHLLADEPGAFTGKNTQYSGDGFADQHFAAVATTPADFEAWIAKVRASPQRLDKDTYTTLAAPSIKHPVTYYAAVEPGLFDTVLAKYAANPSEMRHDGAE